MLPDLRFLIGAVVATALLGVAALGLTAAVHIAHQSKIGPMEASRMLAYTPNEARSGLDQGPFAGVTVSPGGMRPAPPDPPSVDAPPAPAVRTAETRSEAAPLDDVDTVDERAVVDPPLPPETDTAAPSPPAQAVAPVVRAAEPAAATPAPDPAPAIAPPAATAAPVETAPAAPAPVAEIPVEPRPDVEPVGSVTPMTAESGQATPPAVAIERPKAKKAKAKRKAVARAKPRARPRAVQPSASTGYPVTFDTNGFGTPAAQRRGGGATKSLWPGE